MLVPGQDGLLVARRSNPLENVNPTTFEYGSYPPSVESTFVFGRLTGGMGEAIQSSATSKRYRYADRVDCSIGGMPRLGPQFAPAAMPAPLAGDAAVRQVVVADLDTGPTQIYCLRGRGVYALVGGTWTLSRDFGTLNEPQQAVVYRGTTGPTRLLVATALGELWGYDGAAWQQGFLGTTPGDFAANYVEVVGRELYIGAVDVVRVGSTGDPLAVGAAFFGGAIRVGQTGSRITYLRAVTDTLYVFKADGVHTLNADGSDNDLTPEFRAVATDTNGRNAVPWRDALWFGYGDAYYRLGHGGDLAPIGPERLVDNDSPVRGGPVSATPHADWFLYLGIHNSATGTSHLLKYGTWTSADAANDPATYHFDDVWNGALASWAGKQVTRLDVTYLAGAYTLWVGFADGSVESTALPVRTPDPALDPSCRFAPVGTLYAPLHDAVFGADKKSFHAATALAPFLTEEQDAALVYRTDPTAPYRTLFPPFQASGQRLPLPDLTDGAPRDASTGVQLDFGVELRTSSPERTPVLEGLALHEALRPTLHLTWSFTVAASNRRARRDGVVSTRTAESLRALLREAAAAPGHVRMRTPDELVGGFAYVDYREQLAPDRGRDGLDYAIAVTAGQFRPP